MDETIYQIKLVQSILDENSVFVYTICNKVFRKYCDNLFECNAMIKLLNSRKDKFIATNNPVDNWIDVSNILENEE